MEKLLTRIVEKPEVFKEYEIARQVYMLIYIVLQRETLMVEERRGMNEQ